MSSKWSNPQQISIGLGNALASELTEQSVIHYLGPLLLTWFNFNPSMDK